MRSALLILLATSLLLPLATNIEPALALFTVSVSPPSITVPEYGPASFTVTVTNPDPIPVTVLLTFTISGAPISGSSGFFSMNPVTVPPFSTSPGIALSFIASLCPGVYAVTVTATDTAAPAIRSSASSTLSIFPSLPPLDVGVSTDKPSYRIGETVTITMTSNKPADTRLTISGPSGTVKSFLITFLSSGSSQRKLPAAEPVGTYTVTFEGAYCAERDSSTTTYQVSPNTYDVTVSTSGLPSEFTTQLKTDGQPRQQLTGGEIATISFPIDTTHTVEVDQIVSGRTGTRYFCERNKFTVSGTTSITFEYQTQYQFEVTTDPVGIVQVSGGGWFAAGQTVSTGSVPQTLDGPPGVKYEFAGWEVDGVLQQSPSVTVTMDKAHKAVAKYKTLYQLTIESPYGDPQGAGFHEKGTTVKFSVTSPVGFLIQQVFLRWEGDYLGESPSGEILMDGPKTVRAVWDTSYFQLYIALGVLGAVVVVAILLMRRRSATPTLKAPPTPPPPPPPESLGAARNCPNCGAAVPDGQAFCTECGQKMPD